MIVLSGQAAEAALDDVFRPFPTHTTATEGVLRLGHIVDGETAIDEAIVVRCGEEFEINIHGGPAAANATLARLIACGASVASDQLVPQSFPRAHPRWNNPAIGEEMLRLVPHARSAFVVAAITSQWSGGISALVRTTPSASQLRDAAAGLVKMQRVLHPAQIVLAGAPNVGKSTLTNALTARQVSIVHESPGTTRDWVRELALFEGIPVWLTDTAGLWGNAQGVDAEAVKRGRRCMEQADLVLLLHVGGPDELPEWLRVGKLLRVATKCDVAQPTGQSDACVSALTGEGLDQLKRAVLREIGLDGFDPASPMGFTQRQADLLTAAADAMDRHCGETAQKHLQQLLTG